MLELLLNDGHWILGKNILSYLDPDSLVQFGFASRTAKKIVLSYLETSLEENYQKNKFCIWILQNQPCQKKGGKVMENNGQSFLL